MVHKGKEKGDTRVIGFVMFLNVWPESDSLLNSEIVEAIELTTTSDLLLEFAATSWTLKHWDRDFSKQSCACSKCSCCCLRTSVNISAVIAPVELLVFLSPLLCFSLCVNFLLPCLTC